MSCRRTGVAGVLFDCYGTLIDILTGEREWLLREAEACLAAGLG